MSKRLGVEVRPSEIQEEPASAADIVVTCTTSFEPVLFGDWLTKPGLVIGAGANHWNGRELDESIIKKASLVVVMSAKPPRRRAAHCFLPFTTALSVGIRSKTLPTLLFSDARFRSSTPLAFCSHRMVSRSRTLRYRIEFTNWRSKWVWGVISRFNTR